MWWNVPEAEEAGMDGSARPRLLAVAGRIDQKQRAFLTMVPLARVRPNELQPRKYFDDERLAELSQSIKERGLLQPIVVRKDGDDFELLAGERRFRAAKLAGLHRVPALIRDKDDPLEVALIENLQREDLTPLEEAEALAGLIESHGYSHRAVADVLGKSRPYVSNALSLLRLPDRVKAEVHSAGRVVSRELLMGVARSETPEEAEALWSRLKLDLMSVRQFRAERSGKTPAERSAVRSAILAARRLNRALKRLAEEVGSGEDAEVETLKRVLARSRRLIAARLAEVTCD
jgi:ParB family chromosome partitioning protein